MAILPERRCPRRRLAAAAALGVALLLHTVVGAAAADCMPPEAEAARVAEVRDARTVVLSDGRLVRPAGIESFALIGEDTEAADALLAGALAQLLAGRQVRLGFVSDRPDRYGRRAALIASGAGVTQVELAAQGAAIAFPHDPISGCMTEILAAEAAARRASAGRWTSAAVLPAEPGALSSHLGSYVVFEGEVVSVGNRTRRTYLNFGRRWSEDVTVVVEASDRDRFGGTEALAGLAGGRVRVRGFVEEWGGPMVAGRWAEQIEVLAPLEDEENGT
jgi:endonuclease YncB( thermonuclease family)